MAKKAAKPKAVRTAPKGAGKKAQAAAAEKAKDKRVREQAKIKRWDREGVVTVDGKKMIGEMMVTKFARFVAELKTARKGQNTSNKDVTTLMNDFVEAGGNRWAYNTIQGLLKKDEAVRDNNIRHFIMYALQMEACSQPDMFSGLNDGMPTIQSARKLGEMCGMEGGNIDSNPFASLAAAFVDGYKAEQKKLAEKIGSGKTTAKANGNGNGEKKLEAKVEPLKGVDPKKPVSAMNPGTVLN